MAMANSFLNDIVQVSPDLEEEERLYLSMNAELDKQIEKDMQELNNLLRKSKSTNVNGGPPVKTVKTMPKVVQPRLHKPDKSIIEKIESQITEDDVDMYQSINAELDKQIAKDMEQIKNYISKTDGKIDLAKRIEFFNEMDNTPISSNENHVTDHILYQHTPLGNIKWLECIQCDFKSTDKSKLNEHIVAKHTLVENTDWFRCPRCPYMSKDNNDVQKHLKVGHGDDVEEQTFKCKECDATYSKNGDLIVHMKDVHNKEPEFHCKQCPFMSDDQGSLKQHMLAEHIKLNVSWYKCAQCAYRTVRKANLDRHILCKHTSTGFLF